MPRVVYALVFRAAVIAAIRALVSASPICGPCNPSAARSRALIADAAACSRLSSAPCGYAASSLPRRPRLSASQTSASCAMRSGRRNASQRTNSSCTVRSRSSGRRCTFVFTAGNDGKLPIVLRHLEPLAQRLQWRDAALLVHDVARPLLWRRERLAQVVGQCGKAHQRIARRDTRRHIADHFLVNAGIHFRMELGALRHAVQRIDFRQDGTQSIGVVQRA